ncbi:MAG: 23S rRNA (adenine(2503)-C(2))-methyltransferase RlmN, partial [bacterium]
MENTNIKDRPLPEGGKPDLKSMTLPELEEAVKSMSLPAFRARQLYQWMHVKLAADYGAMTNIPAAMKDALEKNFTYTKVRTIDRQISKLDGTQKFLFAMPDDSLVESVFMKYRFGNSICISSQVGCRMGCRFCASTLDGLIRS